MSTPARSRVRQPGRATRVSAYAALGWTLLATLYLLLAPTRSWESTSQTTSGTGEVVTTATSGHETLLAGEGPSVLIVLAVPVVLAAAGAWPWTARRARRARLVAGWLLLIGVLAGAMTIGLFYLPAAVLLLVSGFKAPHAREVERDPSPALGRRSAPCDRLRPNAG